MHTLARPFAKLLVANRGEIAIRVLRAGSELGLRTVAIYTHEDRYSLHRFKADESYQIGKEDEPLKPYLDIEEIISLAKKKQVDAIHPGYGFLSENVHFARRCAEEGIVFVGPRPESMAALGDKVRAKEVAQQQGVPMVPGNAQPLTSVDDALKEAERIGYPLILKAAAGGGGRGMRVAQDAEQLRRFYAEARGEAKSAFGDDTIFLEKFVRNPKHIEVQILGDSQGKRIHLFERDCSVQRRFQKVVEIAPAPTLSQEVKDKLYAYALRLADAVDYQNAGTVEFLVDEDDSIYFIEVNPRIQVEHTVTEAITGIDLVRTQLLIAMGYPLDHPQIFINGQEDVRANGYAVQCRITTEDPSENFRPDYGRIVHYRNAAGMGIRLDEGSSYAGMRISPFYDSMLVKITASGRTLKGACQRMARALSEFRIRGVKTNIPFLQNVVQHEVLQGGGATVRFLEEYPELMQVRVGQNRGTKTLGYLADIIINGHETAGKYAEKPRFGKAVVPDYDPYTPYTPGSKQLLEQHGRSGLVEWIRQQKQILFTDTTMRDAHQSLLATRVRTHDMLQIAESFARNNPNLFSMEVWGGATFDVCMRFLQEDPWERLHRLREAMPNLLLQMLFRGSNGVGYAAYPDNVIQLFIEKAAENGMDIFRIFDSLNWLENMQTSIETVVKGTNSLAEVCICYTGDVADPARTKYDLNYYLDLARRIEDTGAHILAIKDMAGLLKPRAARMLIPKLREHLSIPIHLHTHDTSGLQVATYMEAIEAGVDIVDCALSSLSGLTSQPNLNSVVAMLQGSERQPKLDLTQLNLASNYWEEVRRYYFPFESGLQAATAEVFEHEIPGGQYSNLRPQATALGLGDRWEDIKQNYKKANELFGDIVKVTPSSKVVGDMALFMTTQNLTPEDILERGDSLSFPQSVVSFFRGDLGQPVGGFPKKLQQLILKNQQPYTDRPNAHLPALDIEAEFARFRQRFGSGKTLLDFLSHQMYPKVYEDWQAHRKEHGDVSVMPTPMFFYGLSEGEEVELNIDEGKKLILKYLYKTEPNEHGMRTVYFDMNGQTRAIEARDLSIKDIQAANAKATEANHIGAPLQGRLAKVHVKAGDRVEKNAPLFTIEAMKMETHVTAPAALSIQQVHLAAGALVEAADLIISTGK
ncbi:MAG: pyruvate carboxylase [Bacteroidetes bacterium]|jgi:pyruvate carboxylase|nr:pyruvate carboxylase [Bacteroidota bacterium]